MVWRKPQPPPEPRRDGVKGDADGFGGHLLQLAGDNGGEYQFAQVTLAMGSAINPSRCSSLSPKGPNQCITESGGYRTWHRWRNSAMEIQPWNLLADSSDETSASHRVFPGNTAAEDALEIQQHGDSDLHLIALGSQLSSR